jgi:hypothetical protein
MKQNLFLLLMLLVIVGVGAPFAHADAIVDISVNATFPGTTPTGRSSPELFSANFEYDNTTETILLPTMTTDATGEIRDFSYTGASHGELGWRGPEGSLIFGVIPSTGVILPGVYSTELTLSTDDPDFGFHQTTDATVIVTRVPEPNTLSLSLLGIGLALVMRKRTLTSTI